MITAYVSDDMAGYGVRVAVVSQELDSGEPRKILRLGNDGGTLFYQWEPVERGVVSERGDCARCRDEDCTCCAGNPEE